MVNHSFHDTANRHVITFIKIIYNARVTPCFNSSIYRGIWKQPFRKVYVKKTGIPLAKETHGPNIWWDVEISVLVMEYFDHVGTYYVTKCYLTRLNEKWASCDLSYLLQLYTYKCYFAFLTITTVTMII